MKASFTRENGGSRISERLADSDPLSPEDQRDAVAAVAKARETLNAANDAQSKRVARRALERATAHVIRHNDRLVVMHAKKIARFCRSLDVEDLAQAGRMGLLKALEMYDPTVGASFSTYSQYWVVAYCRRAVSYEDEVVRVPANVLDDRRTLNRHMHAWETAEGRAPELEELAGELIAEKDASGTYRLKGGPRGAGKGIHREPGSLGTIRGKHVTERIQKVLDVNLSAPKSMDEALSHGHGGTDVTLHDLTPASDPSPEEITARREREAMALSLLAELPMRERTVITARFWEEKTLEEIGTINHGHGVGKFGKSVTRERVRQIELEAMRMLREKCA